MTDAELRALVRDAVARHLGRREPAPLTMPAPLPQVSPVLVHEVRPASVHDHPSHYRYVTLSAPDSACVIEPSVACDHCGYCKSHGH